MWRLQTDPEFADLAEAETDIVSQIEAILVKKDEGRPVTPEEYSVLSQFVDRIERGIISMHQAERMAELDKRAEAKEKVPETAFDMPIEELNFSEGLTRLLSEAEYKTVGDLMLQLELDSDAILGLNGIGPKAMEKIELSLAEATFPEPVEVEEEAVEEAAIPETEISDEVAEAEEVSVEPEAEEIEPTTDVEVTQDEELVPAAEVEVAEAEPTEVLKEETVEEEEELPSTLEEIFALKPDAFDVDLATTDFEEEEEEEEEIGARKKKKKKKKKYVEMEYDPDQDVVIVKRKRKRDSEDWEEDWDF